MRERTTTSKLWLAGAILVALTNVGRPEPLATESCLARLSATINPTADVFIGGIFTFSTSGGDYGCNGPFVGTMQEYEAVRGLIGFLNQNSGTTLDGFPITDSYIPGVQLGMRVRDNCDSTQLAIESVFSLYPELTSSDARCSASGSVAMAGLLSNIGSGNSMRVNRILTVFGIPHLATLSTAPSLSNNAAFPFFMRTIPTDITQIETITSVLEELGWLDVAIVYTSGAFGTEGFNLLRADAPNNGVCITAAIAIEEDETSTTVFENTISQLVSGSATAVVFFGDTAIGVRLLEAGQNVAGAGDLYWIMSETIGSDSNIVQGINYARGILTVAPGSRTIPEFEDYWVSLDPFSANPPDNPWFRDWYQQVNDCELPGNTNPLFSGLTVCPVLSEAQIRATFQQGPYVLPAILGVFTYARAIRAAIDDLCPTTTPCNAFRNLQSQDFFNDYLLNVDFEFGVNERIPSLASSLVAPFFHPQGVAFDGRGDILNPSYDVYNYNDNTGTFTFNKVGTFTNDQLSLNIADITVYDASRTSPLPSIPTSSCDADCGPCITDATTTTTRRPRPTRPTRPPPRPQPPSNDDDDDDEVSGLIVGNVILGAALFICMVMSLIICCCCCQRNQGVSCCMPGQYGPQNGRGIEIVPPSLTQRAIAPVSFAGSVPTHVKPYSNFAASFQSNTPMNNMVYRQF